MINTQAVTTRSGMVFRCLDACSCYQVRVDNRARPNCSLANASIAGGRTGGHVGPAAQAVPRRPADYLDGKRGGPTARPAAKPKWERRRPDALAEVTEQPGARPSIGARAANCSSRHEAAPVHERSSRSPGRTSTTALRVADGGRCRPDGSGLPGRRTWQTPAQRRPSAPTMDETVENPGFGTVGVRES